MTVLLQILTSVGAAAPAGFNAYFALILVWVGSRAGWITLTSPFDFLASTPALFVLLFLLTVEIFIDKSPSLASANDAIGTVIRPVAGALIFASTNHVITDANIVVSLVLGAAAAWGVHYFKRTSRRVWNVSSSGIAGPFASVMEDFVAGIVVILAMLAPIAGIVLLILVLGASMALMLKLKHATEKPVSNAR